jgi:hypothetical protein
MDILAMLLIAVGIIIMILNSIIAAVGSTIPKYISDIEIVCLFCLFTVVSLTFIMLGCNITILL